MQMAIMQLIIIIACAFMCIAVIAAVIYMAIDATLGVKYYKQFQTIQQKQDTQPLENDSGGGI